MIFSMFYQTQRSTLGYLQLDVLITEAITLPSEVTKYPVEDGGPDVSDHITQGNEELNIQGSISSAQSFGLEFGYCYSKLISAIDTLRDMHKARKPITVVTGLGRYQDMAFTNLSINRSNSDRGGNWIDINADLRKIRKVALKEAELPPDKVASSGGAKGKAGQSERKTGKTGPGSPEHNRGKTGAVSASEAGGFKKEISGPLSSLPQMTVKPPPVPH